MHLGNRPGPRPDPVGDRLLIDLPSDLLHLADLPSAMNPNVACARPRCVAASHVRRAGSRPAARSPSGSPGSGRSLGDRAPWRGGKRRPLDDRVVQVEEGGRGRIGLISASGLAEAGSAQLGRPGGCQGAARRPRPPMPQRRAATRRHRWPRTGPAIVACRVPPRNPGFVHDAIARPAAA